MSNGNPHDERWETDMPAPGMAFRVLEEEWDCSVDPPVRIIKRVEVISISAERERSP